MYVCVCIFGYIHTSYIQPISHTYTYRHAGSLMEAGSGIEATDSGVLHRSTDMRRRDKTLPLLNEFVARASPVHLPSMACPPESDTKAHNDYKAQVRACARARARARQRVLTRGGRRCCTPAAPPP